VLSSRNVLCAMSLLSCALTLGASGDDFSFLRLTLAPADAISDPLPLDDPNTDFVSSANAGAGRRNHDSFGDDRGPADTGSRAAALIPSNPSAPPPVPHADGGHLPRNELNPPLRC
jgi:hypothetical protein